MRIPAAAALLLTTSLLGADAQEQAFLRAAQALASGNLEAAESGFQSVLQRQSNHVGALGNLGVVYSRMDRPADAVTVYRRALRIAPNEPGLLLNLGLAHLKLEKAAKLNPDEPSIHYQLARAYQSSGRAAEAKQAFARVRDLRSKGLREEESQILR